MLLLFLLDISEVIMYFILESLITEFINTGIFKDFFNFFFFSLQWLQRMQLFFFSKTTISKSYLQPTKIKNFIWNASCNQNYFHLLFRIPLTVRQIESFISSDDLLERRQFYDQWNLFLWVRKSCIFFLVELPKKKKEIFWSDKYIFKNT